MKIELSRYFWQVGVFFSSDNIPAVEIQETILNDNDIMMDFDTIDELIDVSNRLLYNQLFLSAPP